jgi:hypothetical protein
MSVQCNIVHLSVLVKSGFKLLETVTFSLILLES